MDAADYYALLRFEEAALALRTALAIDLVDRMGDQPHLPKQIEATFGFTSQGARTFFSLLNVMHVVDRTKDGGYVTTPLARHALANNSPTSRRPYLGMGSKDDVDELIRILRGEPSDESLPLYGRESEPATLMDQETIAQEIAIGLSSRARNFARPLAQAIGRVASPMQTQLADLGAGSPYLAVACRQQLPQLERILLVDRPNGMRWIRQICQSESIDPSCMEFIEQDFFRSVPYSDIYVLSNTAHDWLPTEYEAILQNIHNQLPPHGIICVHEPLLKTDWDNKTEWCEALWMACYALTLFRLTHGKGSCYSIAEHDSVQRRVGFHRIGEPVPTTDGCTALFYSTGR